MTNSPDPQSKRSQRRAARRFTGTRAQRRNAKRLAWKGVTCNSTGTSPESLSFEGHEPKQRHMQYKGGGNNYHA